MGNMIDGLKKNRVLAFVLSLTLASSLALPTLGFANGEAVDTASAAQEAVEDVAAPNSATEFDENVEGDVVESDVVAITDVTLGTVVDPDADVLSAEGVGAIKADAEAEMPTVETLADATAVEEPAGTESGTYGLLNIDKVEIKRLTETEIEVRFDAAGPGRLSLDFLDAAGTSISTKTYYSDYSSPGTNFVVFDAPEVAQAAQVKVQATYDVNGSPTITAYGPYPMPAYDETLTKEITAFKVKGVEGVIDGSHIFLYAPKGTLFENVAPEVFTDTGKDRAVLVGEKPSDVTTKVTFTPNVPVRYVVADSANNYRMYDVYVVYVPTITDLTVERTGMYQAKVRFTSDSVGEYGFGYLSSSAEKSWLLNEGTMSVGANEINVSWSPSDPNFAKVDEWKDNKHAAKVPALSVHVNAISATETFQGTISLITEIPAWTPPTPMIDRFVIKVPGKDDVAANIDQATGKITAEVPYGTDLDNNLKTVVTYTGETLNGAKSSSPVTADVKFAGSVEYVVTGLEGTTPKTYTVTVTVAAPKPPTMDTFRIVLPGSADEVNASIDQGAKTIAVTVPYGTDLKSLTPKFDFTGVSAVSDPATPDFSKPVTYTVTGEDGRTLAVYTLNVTVAPPSAANDITSFVIAGNAGVVDGTTIVVEVPFGTDVTDLTPVVAVSEFATYTPAGAQDFTSPVAYTVTAQNGDVKTYTASVTVLPEVVVETPAAETPPTTTATSVPQTGDSSPSLILIMVLLINAGLAFMVSSRRRIRTGRHTK
ncbi:MAG TPA: hypothetical protein DEB24_01995 [Coriobacteriia bacterium]|nr:hypothetical protein [Coriobacteriia bacterium]